MGRHGSAASMSTAKVSKSASCESHLSGSVSGELTKDSTTSSMSSGSQLSLSRDEIASSLERPYDAEGPEINEVSTVLSVPGWVCVPAVCAQRILWFAFGATPADFCWRLVRRDTNLLPSVAGGQHDLSPGILLSLSSALNHSATGPTLAQIHSVNYPEKGTRSLEAASW